MESAWFRNVSNLDLVEPNQISDSIYACMTSLFTKLSDVENVAYMRLLVVELLAVRGDQYHV